MGILQASILEWLPCPPPGDLPNLETEPKSPTLQVHSLPSEPPGKPKNTGVGSLFLLQGIFPTQGIEPGSPALQAVSLPTELSGKPLKHDKTCCKTFTWLHTHTHTGVHRRKQGWFHGELLLKPHRAACSEGPLLGLRVLIILFLDTCFVSEVCGMLECVHEQIFGDTPPCI